MEDGSATAHETILRRSGRLGFYQKRVYLLCTCVQAVTLCCLLYLCYVSPEVTSPPRCATNGHEAEPQTKGSSHDVISVTTTSMWNESTLVAMDWTLAEKTEEGGEADGEEVGVGQETNNTDVKIGGCKTQSEQFYLLSTVVELPEWLEGVDKVMLEEFAVYCQAVGAVLGCAVGAMCSDTFGRRRTIFLSCAVMLLIQGLTGLAPSWHLYATCRFLVGLFAGSSLVGSIVLPVEVIGQGVRDACVCGGLWTSGVLVVTLEALATRNWRLLAAIISGLGLPFVGCYYLVRESPRWLLCHHRYAESEAGFREIISCNTSAVADLTSLLDKSRTCVASTMHPKRYSFLDMFHTRELAKSTLTFAYLSFTASTVYFCLWHRVGQLTGNDYADTFLPFLIDMPLPWSAVVVNRCLGRRWCLFLYAVASGLALLSVLVLHMTGNLAVMPSMTTGLAVFGKLGVTASLSLILVMVVEIYPTVIRSCGTAVALMCAVCGCIAARQILVLDSFHYTVPFVVYGAMMVSVGVTGLALPETLHTALPNILACRHRPLPMQEGRRLVRTAWDKL